MGDMADYYLSSQSPDSCEDMSTDWYEYGGTLSCKYCGTSDLRWVEDERTGKYRLASQKGIVHRCKEYVSSHRR